jgi:hypothetical protein
MCASMDIDANSSWLSTMCNVHFNEKDLATVTCSDCLDFKTRQCMGKGLMSYECVACIKKHAEASHQQIMRPRPKSLGL